MTPPILDPAFWTPLRVEKALVLAIPYGSGALGLLCCAIGLGRAGRFHSRAMLLAGLVAFFWLYLYTVCWKLVAPIPDPVEESIWMQVWQLRRGLTIYPNPEAAPAIGYMYPPVFHATLAGLFTLFGPHWWVGRLLSIGCSLAIGWLIYRIIRTDTGSTAPALIGALFFFTFYQLTDEWLDLMRVDTLALWLSLLALWQLRRCLTRPAAVWWGVLCTVLACYTKQSSLYVVLTGGAWLLMTQRRAGVVYLLSVGLLGGGLFALLNRLTDGWFAVYTLLDPWRHQANWAYLGDIARLLMRSAGLWMLAAAYLWQTAKRRGYQQEPQRLLWPLAFVGGCALSLTNSLMAGSGVHNMMAAVAFLCVLIGLALHEWRDIRWLPVALCLQLIPLVYIPVLPNRVDHQLRQRLMQEAANAPGEYLARCLTCAQLNGKTVHDNLGAVDELITTRLWDGRRLIHEVEQARFDPLIVTETYGSRAIQAAVERHYVLTETVSNAGSGVSRELRIYRPRRAVRDGR
ncbi:MAG: glycosyltransferase family 39 protein [Candidatus Omnitrophica bacterium]|nr:glycosyltransferase family 39 protein [Candidatus Omnitrophota bacterium]